MYSRSGQLNMGVDRDTFIRCQNHVWLSVARGDKFKLGMNVESISQQIKGIVEQTESKAKIAAGKPVSKVGHEWLIAEASTAWAAMNVIYNSRVTDLLAQGVKGPEVDTVRLADPLVTLSTQPAKAVCSGYSVLVRDVARALDVKCNILQGHLRPNNWKAGMELGGHCWIEFIFEGDVHVPADPTLAANSAVNATLSANGKFCGFAVLPRSQDEWEVFLARHYNWSPIPKNITTLGDAVQSTAQLNITEEQWLDIPTTSIESLERKLSKGQ